MTRNYLNKLAIFEHIGEGKTKHTAKGATQMS